MLEKLKINKNPHYKFYEDYHAYHTRCKTTDPSGYEVVFNEDTDDILEIIDKMEGTQVREVVDEIVSDGSEANIEADEDVDNNDEKDEIEFLTKDPVKRYQFKYNESLYMTDK